MRCRDRDLSAPLGAICLESYSGAKALDLVMDLLYDKDGVKVKCKWLEKDVCSVQRCTSALLTAAEQAHRLLRTHKCMCMCKCMHMYMCI